MQFVELVALRLVLFLGLPLLACVLIFGPVRVEQALVRGWNWFWGKRYEPEALLRRVVAQQEQRVAVARLAAQRAEADLNETAAAVRKSEAEMAHLVGLSRRQTDEGNQLAARAALLKLKLERAQNAKLGEQHQQALAASEAARRELYGAELQLRQYEVGRDVFLREAAAAQTMAEQLALARKFDPFHTIASWRNGEAVAAPLASSESASPALTAAESEAAITKQQLHTPKYLALDTPPDANEAINPDESSEQRPQRSAPLKGEQP